MVSFWPQGWLDAAMDFDGVRTPQDQRSLKVLRALRFFTLHPLQYTPSTIYNVVIAALHTVSTIDKIFKKNII